MNTTPKTAPSGEPKLASFASWAVLVASFGLSATTWIALAELAGFDGTATIPGLGITVAMSWLMPIAVDGYVVVALVLWMSPVPKTVAAFAKKNTYFAAGTGIIAQSAYHLLDTASTADQQWKIYLAAIVGAIPPTVAGLAIHMRALIRREIPSTITTTNTASSTFTPSIPVPAIAVPAAPATPPAATPAPVMPTIDQAPARPAPVAPVQIPVPTPDVVAPRIASKPYPSPRTGQAPAVAAAAPVHPRTNAAQITASPLDTSATDSSVNEPEALQLALPMFSPQRIARARELAAQFRAQHGTPITAGTLAVRLRIPTEQASQLLTEIENVPSVTPVNGQRVTAA
jgi:hypothetical protein